VSIVGSFGISLRKKSEEAKIDNVGIEKVWV